MNVLYTFIIRSYRFAIQIAALFHPKAKLWINGRKNWSTRLACDINPNEQWIWVHCSSIGEFEDCAEIIAAIRKQHHSSKIILTFFSPSGMEAKGIHASADYVTYLPIDTRSNAKQFLNLINPTIILFSRSELWYNFLSEIAKRKIPIFLISALLDPSSKFIQWPQKKLYQKCFNVFTQIYCQNNQTKELLEKHFNLYKSTVAGNSRIDRVYKSYAEKEYEKVAEFIGNSFCVIVGSSLDIDEKMILRTMKKLNHLNIKWIIVPHEINEKKINQQVKMDASTFIRFSTLETLTENHSVLYIDFVGGLKHLYQYANVAVIGGGFNRIGIHNILEPTFHGIPTTFGPNHRNYPEAIELLNRNFAHIHHNQLELQQLIENYYTNPIDDTMNNDIKHFIHSTVGASNKIVADINERVNS